jgi:hypothetical protein
MWRTVNKNDIIKQTKDHSPIYVGNVITRAAVSPKYVTRGRKRSACIFGFEKLIAYSLIAIRGGERDNTRAGDGAHLRFGSIGQQFARLPPPLRRAHSLALRNRDNSALSEWADRPKIYLEKISALKLKGKQVLRESRSGATDWNSTTLLGEINPQPA